MFLIGEEQILIDPEAGRDPDPRLAIERADTRRLGRLPTSQRGARTVTALGLAATVPLLVLLLRPGGGQGPARPAATSSPRSPLISRSAASVPTRPTARAHPRKAAPAEVHRPDVVHRRSHRSRGPAPVPAPVIQSESEREPTPQVAPVSSSTVAAPAPDPGPQAAPPATATPTPHPGPPPSSSGGGPAGVESFGFER